MGARDLLADLAGAGFRITAEGGRLVVRPWSKLTDDMRAALRDVKPELLGLLSETGGAAPADSWTDADIAAFVERRARLLRWGWTEDRAEALAERLVIRDREADDRVSCSECRQGRASRCADVAPLPADVLHRCARFQP